MLRSPHSHGAQLCREKLCWDDMLGKEFTGRGRMDNECASVAMSLLLDATCASGDGADPIQHRQALGVHDATA